MPELPDQGTVFLERRVFASSLIALPPHNIRSEMKKFQIAAECHKVTGLLTQIEGKRHTAARI